MSKNKSLELPGQKEAVVNRGHRMCCVCVVFTQCQRRTLGAEKMGRAVTGTLRCGRRGGGSYCSSLERSVGILSNKRGSRTVGQEELGPVTAPSCPHTE